MQRRTTRIGLLSFGSFCSRSCAATRSSTDVAGSLMRALISRRRAANFVTSFLRSSFLLTFETFAIEVGALILKGRYGSSFSVALFTFAPRSAYWASPRMGTFKSFIEGKGIKGEDLVAVSNSREHWGNDGRKLLAARTKKRRTAAD